MGFKLTCVAFLTAVTISGYGAETSPLKRSDVVFMYQAPREIYEGYGATVMAWGGTPTPETLATTKGMLFFGSVGMVTEFSRYYEFEPATYEAGLCRDREGNPYKVPWLTDHQHKGIPYWWCCTSQPRFQSYLSNRVVQVVKAGVDGVHIDDHMGTAGSLWLGACFCERCVEGFRQFLAQEPAESWKAAGVTDLSGFDFRKHLNEWIAAKADRKQEQHPLWPKWRVYHLRNSATYMMELRDLAKRTAGRHVPMSANAGLLWGQHLADYKAVDFFSSEIDHHGGENSMNDHPVLGYRLADAVGRLLASTASGQDWAHIKEQKRAGLVQGWIALSYASGHSLMAPNRQWCYTKEKGTHWYDGPREKFAPLYQFARTNAHLIDGYENLPDVIVAMPHQTLDRNPGKMRDLTAKLSGSNLAFSLALGSDDYVDHPLTAADFKGNAPVLVVDERSFTEHDKVILATIPKPRLYTTVESALSNCVAAAEVKSTVPVRVFPRGAKGKAVVHVVNWKYDAVTDGFEAAKDVVLEVRPAKIGLKRVSKATLHAPGHSPANAAVKTANDERVQILIPEVSIWTLVELE